MKNLSLPKLTPRMIRLLSTLNNLLVARRVSGLLLMKSNYGLIYPISTHSMPRLSLLTTSNSIMISVSAKETQRNGIYMHPSILISCLRISFLKPVLAMFLELARLTIDSESIFKMMEMIIAGTIEL